MSGRSVVRSSVSRRAILERAWSHLVTMKQMADTGLFSRAAAYEAKAEALVELLEVDDCGSYGGFDAARGQPSPRRLDGRDRLADRLQWLESITPKESQE